MSRNALIRSLQILCPAADDEAQDHVVDDPLDGGVVVGEDGRRFVVRAETGEGHLHGVDEQSVDARIIAQFHQVCGEVFGLCRLFGGEDDRVQRAGDVHHINGGEDRRHGGRQPVDEAAVAGDGGRVDGQDSAVR